jgi:soluble lytic murein transglycosylase-like protein
LSKTHRKIEKRILAAIRRATRYGRVAIFFALFLAVITSSRSRVSHASEIAPRIDLNAIAMIESSGNPLAYNKEGSYGLFQISEITLKEYNLKCVKRYTRLDLFRPDVSREIASWYLEKRIPQMLRHFKKPVTVRNTIIAWNAGIKTVVTERTIPRITSLYLKKYDQLAKD